MNLRQKKKLFKKKFGMNPLSTVRYTSLTYHAAVKKIWGGQIKVGTVEDFNHRVQGRNTQIRASRRYTR